MDQLEIQEDGSEQQEKEKKLQQRSLEFFSEKLQAIVDEAKSKSILNLKHSMRNDKDSCFEPDAYTTVKAIISIAGSIPGAKDLTDATDQIVDAFRGVKTTLPPEMLSDKGFILKYVDSKTGVVELLEDVKNGKIIF